MTELTFQLSFTGGNVAWVDEKWTLHTDFAFFTPLRLRHTGVNLAAPLAAWIQSRRLGGRVLSITTDGASNNITMLERLAQTPYIEFNNQKDHVLCSCHCIGRVVFVFMKNLGCTIPALRPKQLDIPSIFINDALAESEAPEAQDDRDPAEDLQELSQLDHEAESFFDDEGDEEEAPQEADSEEEQDTASPSTTPHGNAARMATKFCRMTMRSSHLVAAFRQLSGGRALKRVAGIRWANDVEVWESVLEHRQSIHLMLLNHHSHYTKHDIRLEGTDYLALERLQSILAPLRDFTRDMEGNKPTGSLVIHMWLQLVLHLKTMRSRYSDAPDIVCALSAAIRKAEGYLAQASQCRPLLIATALNPQCRLRFFSKNSRYLSTSSNEVRGLLIDVCEQIFQEQAQTPQQLDSDKPEALSTAPTSQFLDFGDDSDEEQTPTMVVEAEIDRYNHRSSMAGSQGLQQDALKWWEVNSHLFPTLSKAAQRYLSVLGAQAVTERLFSASAAVCNPRRMGNILPETISAQVGTDQLLLNDYRAGNEWGDAQEVIRRYIAQQKQQKKL